MQSAGILWTCECGQWECRFAQTLMNQDQLWLIRNRDRDACFRAFLNNNYFGMSMFIGILLTYQFRP